MASGRATDYMSLLAEPVGIHGVIVGMGMAVLTDLSPIAALIGSNFPRSLGSRGRSPSRDGHVSEPTGVVPARRLQLKPAAGVWALHAGLQLKLNAEIARSNRARWCR